MTYYPEYVPKNANHFEAMLKQFRGAPTEQLRNDLLLCWLFDSTVAREDILVAVGRVEREKQP